MYVTATEGAAKQDGTESVGPMVTSIGDIDFWGASEFTSAYDDRGIEKLASF